MKRGLPSKGDRISEYILEEKLGAGGFGEVWKAVHAFLPDEVAAIKIPTNPDFIDNLRREGTILHALRGKHIVEVKGLDPYADPPYLVMEYVAGKTLRQILKEKKGLDPKDALEIYRQALLALQTAHRQGVIHRDVKPENFLIDPEGVVKLTDFGLGRATEATASCILQSGGLRTEGTGQVAGTLRYMSPEQREGSPVDARTDLYSIGVVLFEMLLGEPPQGAELPSDLKADLPKWADRIFARCYTRLERRYGNATEALEDLESLSPGAPKQDIVFLEDVRVDPPPPPIFIRPEGVKKEPRPLWMLPFFGVHAVFEGIGNGIRNLVSTLRDGGGAARCGRRRRRRRATLRGGGGAAGVAVLFLALFAAGGGLVFLASRPARNGTPHVSKDFQTAFGRMSKAYAKKDWETVWEGLSIRARVQVAEIAGYSPTGKEWVRQGWRILDNVMLDMERDPPGALAALEESAGKRVSFQKLSDRTIVADAGGTGMKWIRESTGWKLDGRAAGPPGARRVRKSESERTR